MAARFVRFSESLASVRNGGKLFSLVFVDERLHDLVQITFENLGELIERQVDAMIRDPALREIVGPNSLRAIAAADLQFALFGLFARLAAVSTVEQFAPAAATSRVPGFCAVSVRPGTQRQCRSAGA